MALRDMFDRARHVDLHVHLLLLGFLSSPNSKVHRILKPFQRHVSELPWRVNGADNSYLRSTTCESESSPRLEGGPKMERCEGLVQQEVAEFVNTNISVKLFSQATLNYLRLHAVREHSLCLGLFAPSNVEVLASQNVRAETVSNRCRIRCGA